MLSFSLSSYLEQSICEQIFLKWSIFVSMHTFDVYFSLPTKEKNSSPFIYNFSSLYYCTGDFLLTCCKDCHLLADEFFDLPRCLIRYFVEKKISNSFKMITFLWKCFAGQNNCYWALQLSQCNYFVDFYRRFQRKNSSDLKKSKH